MSVNPPTLKIMTEDLLDGAKGVPDCSVDMIFTSPPYKKKDGYTPRLMQVLGEVCGRVLRPGGRVYMNFGQLREGFARPDEARNIVEAESGLEAGQTIAWIKSMALPGWQRGALERLKPLVKRVRSLRSFEAMTRENLLAELLKLEDYLEGPGDVYSRGHSSTITHKSPTLTYCWEPVFSFFKPPELALNRLSIGCQYADKTNLKRGTRGKHGDVKCAGDTWWIPYKTTGAKVKKATATMGNAYSFPVELPLRAIKLSNMAKGCVVLDPFMGSGTTAVAAKMLGMHAWGIELDPDKVPVIEQRWREVGDGQGESE